MDCNVAPIAGAWIEMWQNVFCKTKRRVAPLAGAWIEMMRGLYHGQKSYSRSPRGSVD